MAKEELEDARKRLSPLLEVVVKPSTLWHRTSPAALRGILRTGAIQPNDGRFPTTYPQSHTCYGRHLGAVCLFDFVTHDILQCIAFSDRWARFFQDVGAATVAIQINPKALNPSLLTGPMAEGQLPPTIQRPDRPPYVPMFIPRVEAWYRGEIPVKAFQEYVVFRRNGGHEHVSVPVADSAITQIDRLENEWGQREDNERRARAARGEIDLADIIKNARENL